MAAETHPQTRFLTTRDGVRIAYSVTGEGRPLVFVRGVNSHLDFMWEDPEVRAYFQTLARHHRLVRFDARGNGLSDHGVGSLTFEGLVDDIHALFEQLELTDAVLYGQGFGGPAAIAYAAAAPDRVTDLVLYCTCADGRPLAPGLSRMAELFRTDPDAALALLVYESYPTSDRVSSLKIRDQRQHVDPATMAAHFVLAAEMDVTDVLARVRARTLVLHPERATSVPVALARSMAAEIADARFVTLPGGSYNPWGEHASDSLRAISEFLGWEHEDWDTDQHRVLATVLFTDIVGSTEQVATIGDRRWTEIINRHDTAAREIVGRFGGRYLKDTGDGLMATFDRPASAIRCALATREGMRELGVEIRAGIHAGELTTGPERVSGIALHVAARVCDAAGAGEILVSRTVADVVFGSEIPLEPRGEHQLKGVPGTWALFTVNG